MVKKYIVVILTLILVLSLSACKGTKSDSNIKKMETTSEDVVSIDEEQEESATESNASNAQKETIQENIVGDTWSDSLDNNSGDSTSSDEIQGTLESEESDTAVPSEGDSSIDDSDCEYEDDEGWLPWV